MDTITTQQTGEVVALGWTLLHFCWQTTVIALVYAVVDRCMARASTPIRYGLSIAALALMALTAVTTFMSQERLLIPAERYQKQVIVSQLGPLHMAIVDQIPLAAPAMGNSELWIAEHADHLMPWVDGLWLAGVLLLSLRAALGWLRLRTLRSRAQSPVPQPVAESFAKLARQFRMGRRVILRISNDVISPMVIGVWRITVIVPLSASLSLAPEQLEAVLAHELAHVRRWDYLCNLLQTAVECLFFFHPAMWWVSKRAREFREVCCDEIAAKACADPVIYAEALLQLEEQRAQHMRLAMAFHGDGGTLLNRIRRVMGEKAMEMKTISGMKIITAGLVLACLYVAPHVAHGAKTNNNQGLTAGSVTATMAAPTLQAAPLAEHSPRTSPESAAQPEPVAAVAAIAPAPEPLAIAVTPQPAAPAPMPNPQPIAPVDAVQNQGGGAAFLDGMRSAGYTLDLNKDLDVLISLKSVGVTPAYAKAMAQAGFGTPTLHDLISLKSVGVTPEYAAGLKSTAAAPASFHDLVSEKSLGITPDYARSVAAMNLGTPTMHDLVSLKSMGITSDYVAGLKAGGITPENLHELVSLKGVGITPEYARSMAAAGFTSNNTHDLISMKALGMTPDSVKWLKTTFPDADIHALKQATVFHIDPEFVANAKAHGFNTASLDKLTKLKMSGLLN